jgi:hypothetical protein
VADINRYSQASSLSAGDQIAVWSTGDGDTRKASLAQVKAFTTPGDTSEATEYSAPSATGFTATISNTAGANVWLYLTPGAGYAAGTIALPSAANSVHGQEVVVSCTQSVGTLTVTSSGGTVTGAPSSLSANGFFRLKFESVTKTWQRVG